MAAEATGMDAHVLFKMFILKHTGGRVFVHYCHPDFVLFVSVFKPHKITVKFASGYEDSGYNYRRHREFIFVTLTLPDTKLCNRLR